MNKLIIKKALLLLLHVFNTALTIYLALLTKDLLDSLNEKKVTIFFEIALISIFIIFLVIIAQTILIKLKNNIIYDEMEYLRIQTMNAVMSKRERYLSEGEHSEYFSFFTNALEIYEKSFLKVKLNLIGSSIMFFAAFFTIVSFDILFLPLILISIISIIIIPMLVSKKIQELSDNNIKKFEDVINKTREYLDTFYITKVYGITDVIIKKYSITIKESMKSKKIFEDKLGLSNAVIAFLNMCISMSIYILGGYLVIKGKLTIGSLIAVGQLLANLFSPLMEIVFAYNEISSTKGIRKTITDTLSNKIEENNVKVNNLLNMKVILESLSYDENDILRNVILKIKKGEKYAIVGGNGCGKSSIAKIISGIAINFKGNILINDENINFSDLQKQNIIYCSKHNQLYNESVEENLRMVERNFGKNINSDVLIKDIDIKQNIDTLSEGEKQKVILYRTINSNYDIKIYDEPESALDVETKKYIFDEILKDNNATNIVITHKIDDNLSKFSRIIYIYNKECLIFNSYDEFISWKNFQI